MVGRAGRPGHKSDWQHKLCLLFTLILSVDHIVCCISKARDERAATKRLSARGIFNTSHWRNIRRGLTGWTNLWPSLSLFCPPAVARQGREAGPGLVTNLTIASQSRLSLRGRGPNLAPISDHQEFDLENWRIGNIVGWWRFLIANHHQVDRPCL